MLNLKIQYYLKLIFIISLVSLISAFFIEYILGYQPCNLCLVERIPYGLSLIILITNYILPKYEKFFIILLILTFLFSLSISFYHLGIEQGFFEESAVCGIQNSTDIISKEELLKQLSENKNVSCKDVTFRVFGLSLTSINIVISLIIIFILIKSYNTYEKIK